MVGYGLAGAVLALMRAREALMRAGEVAGAGKIARPRDAVGVAKREA